jgi:ABC-2 type transport system ATP-binding protein
VTTRGGTAIPAAFLSANDLHKSFNDHKAVNGVSFTIDEGEIFGLLGPNEAGKTTTVRILSTIPHAECGDVMMVNISSRHPIGRLQAREGRRLRGHVHHRLSSTSAHHAAWQWSPFTS